MQIKGYNLNDNLVVEIGRFAILWNCFERFQCNNNCNTHTIRAVSANITIDRIKQAKLASVLNERRGLVGQLVQKYIETGLYPGNARRTKDADDLLMKSFLEQNNGDVCCGCLLVIYRIRNNLMHGLKCIEELNDQFYLFEAVNDVLESIKVNQHEQV